MSAPRLVLASASPRRRQLLEQLGLRFDIEPADVDEALRPGEAPEIYVERLARQKAGVVAERATDAIVVAGDTTVVVDGQILGKPATAEEAVAMLLRLQGREHRVATGVAIAVPEGRVTSSVETVDVRFRALDRPTAEAYVATGEPMDKAGAYGIQGYGAALVESIRGDYFAVMGLPVARVVALLEELGWRYRFPELRRVDPGDRSPGP